MFESPKLALAALVGSLRNDSFNRKVFETLVERAPDQVDIFELPIGHLPFYNEDLDDDDPPHEVTGFREAVSAADGLLFISPEYNHSIPGVLKNAIDWGSRPMPRPPLYGKPGAILGASSGRSGTMRAQLSLRQILPVSNVLLLNKPDVYVSYAAEKFDDDGHLVDHVTLDQLDAFIAAFTEWIALVASRQTAAVG